MGNVWTITRHTLAESIRQKTVVFLIVLLAVLMLGLPFATRGDDTLSGAVQSFLTYSLTVLGFLLSCVTIFLSKTVSDDLTGKQILILMTKPLARWQYVVGKWLGIVLLDTIVLAIAGVMIYAMTMYIAGELRGSLILMITSNLLQLFGWYAILRALSPQRFSAGRWILIYVVLYIMLLVATVSWVSLAMGFVSKLNWVWIGVGIAFPIVALFMGYGILQIIVPRQMPFKHWAWIFGLCLGVSMLGDGILFALNSYQKSFTVRDEYDRERLENQVLQARHASRFRLPVEEFQREANTAFDQGVEDGRYANVDDLNAAAVRKKLTDDVELRWRSVQPIESRVLEFEDIRCDRSPENIIHLSYRLRVYNYPPDEILRCVWIVGDRTKGATEYQIPRRDVIDRRHTLPIPADAVAPDGTLLAVFVNENIWAAVGEQQAANVVVFEGNNSLEVLFAVSSFGSNLVRALALVLCRLAFLAAMAVMLTTVLSFPVACLVALTVYMLAAGPSFLGEAIDWLPDEGLFRYFAAAMQMLLWFIHTVFVPKFTLYDGVSTLVEGRNVTLMWVITGITRLVLIQTAALLLVACLLFRRREVSEISL